MQDPVGHVNNALIAEWNTKKRTELIHVTARKATNCKEEYASRRQNSTP